MLTTNTRTTIGLLAAAVTAVVAIGAIAPVAYGAPKGADAQKAHERACEDLWTIFEGNVEIAGAADQAGDTKARDAALDSATSALNSAQGLGCGWAVRRAPRQTIAVAPVRFAR
jgi:hypothetical protein